MTVTLSATALGDFFTCPHKFRLSREWYPDGIPEPFYFRFGHQVHGLLAGTVTQASQKERHTAQILLGMETALGLRSLGREVKQTFQHLGFTFKRILDNLVRDREDRPGIVDYKTGKAWETVETPYGPMAPKAWGFQPVLYLLDPMAEPNPFGEDWADHVTFLVFGGTGRPSQHDYYLQTADLDNLEEAVAEVADAIERRRFPRIRGYSCEGCVYAQRCFETPGWEALYKPTGLVLGEG